MSNHCRVYWGTHGCCRNRGHDGPHLCDCGTPPYHGRWTRFYGEDVRLPHRIWWHIAGWYYTVRSRRLRSVHPIVYPDTTADEGTPKPPTSPPGP